MKPADDLCDTCHQNAVLLMKAGNVEVEERLNIALKHINRAKTQREFYKMWCHQTTAKGITRYHHFTFIGEKVFCKQFVRYEEEEFHFQIASPPYDNLPPAPYAANAIAAYEDLNINYVPKVKNVPNVPQLRPIERFWRNLKREVYSGGWEASSHKELKQRILLKIRQSKTSTF
ncbi:hypothetical protein ILUMI_15549 [Ignelater luminosus]|uniref:Uncharacterized protein n=1 Tax=Ignelater luminosus TaxID=2038154 RepID=A0A8K0G903_IGNLU|nr:hypothetical protein ILUMI_15549 [Ignelater luminosus]